MLIVVVVCHIPWHETNTLTCSLRNKFGIEMFIFSFLPFAWLVRVKSPYLCTWSAPCLHQRQLKINFFQQKPNYSKHDEWSLQEENVKSRRKLKNRNDNYLFAAAIVFSCPLSTLNTTSSPHYHWLSAPFSLPTSCLTKYIAKQNLFNATHFFLAFGLAAQKIYPYVGFARAIRQPASSKCFPHTDRSVSEFACVWCPAKRKIGATNFSQFVDNFRWPPAKLSHWDKQENWTTVCLTHRVPTQRHTSSRNYRWYTRTPLAEHQISHLNLSPSAI